MFKSKFGRANKALKQQQQLPVFKQDYFKNCHRTYSCIHCRAHLANHDELISKLFQGNHGRAYLFNKVVNIGCKQAVERELLTGRHDVADIFCDSCETTLGWKYEQAYVPSQKYKEGKYIIELVHMLKENDWDLTSYNAEDLLKEEEVGLNSLHLDHFKIGNSPIDLTERTLAVRSTKSKTYQLGTTGTTTNGSLDNNSSIMPPQQGDTISSQFIINMESEANHLGLDDVRPSQLQTQSLSNHASKTIQRDDRGQQSNAQIDMSAGLEMVERPIDRLNSGVRQEGSAYTGQNCHLSVSTPNPSVSPQDSLCSSRSPSDLSSSINETSTSCTT